MRDDAVMLADGIVAPGELAGAWTIEPVLVATVAVTATVFARGNGRLSERIDGVERTGRAVAFYAGLLVVGVALLSPLDALAAALFSAHMAQHLLLMVVAAPLLAYARPAAALVAGLPRGGRSAMRRAGHGRLRATAGALSHPIVVWGIGAVVVWGWHMPSLYEWALSSDIVHVAEHATFLGAAVLFWHVVLASGTRRGVPRPVGILLVFASGVQSSALGAVLLFASTALYPVHRVGAELWGRTPLSDQQLAGALMWGPPAFLYIVTMGWLLVRWFGELDARPAARPLATVGEPT